MPQKKKSTQTKADAKKQPFAKPLSKDEKIHLLRQMVRIRRFEEQSLRSYQQGKIGGFLHLYIGQEAVAVGAVSVMDKS